MYSFPDLEPVCCSLSSSNSCFLTCIQISQEAGQVVWYSHLFQNFPQFIVIHTVKGFGTVKKQKQMFFWNSLAFLMTQQMLGIWSLVPLPFLIPAWTPGPRRKEQWPHKRLCWTCLWVSRVSSRGMGQWWPAAWLGALSVAGHAWDLLREVTIIFIKVKLKSLSCVWLFTNSCLPGSSIHGISQARILGWVAISFSSGSFRPKDQTRVFYIAVKFFTTEPPAKSLEKGMATHSSSLA